MNSSSLLANIIDFFRVIFGAFHFHYMYVLVVVIVCSALVLPRLPANNYFIRNITRVIVVIFLLIIASGTAQLFSLEKVASLMDELARLVAGMLVIHLAGQVTFNVIFPLLRFSPPRILEDIIIVLVYIAWIMVCLRYAGLDFSSLITTSAVMTAIIAFSMQETLSNILGGLALQTDKSINIGDWVKVDGVGGRIIQVTWRHTAVRTRDGEVVVLPNSLLMKSKFSIIASNEVQQWRRWVYFYVSDRVPPLKIVDAVNAALNGAKISNVSKVPAPQCVVMDFSKGATQYAVRYWLTDAAVDDPTDSNVRLHIYALLQRLGYSLVHPMMDVSLTQNNDEREQLLREKEITLRTKTLRQIEMFNALSNEEILHVATNLIYAPFAQGSIITRQGAVAHWLYVLVSGEVEIWNESNGSQQYLSHLQQGSIFGEGGLMTGQPRRATVTAKTNVECYRIDKVNFEYIMQSRPELAEAFAQILAGRIDTFTETPSSALTKERHASQLLENIRRFFGLA